MKKNKAKKKAIHAELRKESKTFEGWMKYEVTIKNIDGSLETIPAYGKDLQDALSRVVHDEKVEKVLPKINKVPQQAWIILWFISIGITTTQVLNHQESLGDWVGLIFVGSMATITSLTIAISNWFSLRNTDRPY